MPRAAARPGAATATRKMAATRLALVLLFVSGVAYGQAPEKKPAPELSKRQAEGISKRERMIACDRQAREAKLATAKRHEFIRDCIKGDTAAAGSGARK